MNNKQNNNNQGFRLLSYQSLEPRDGDKLIFIKSINKDEDWLYDIPDNTKEQESYIYNITKNGNSYIVCNDITGEEIEEINGKNLTENYKQQIWDKIVKEIHSKQKNTKDHTYTFETNTTNNLYGENVSVQAIVGKNGSGKSSIIEMIIRIFNNLSFLAWGTEFKRNCNYHLYFIENIFAKISFCFYEKNDDENKYNIIIKGRKIIINNKQIDNTDKIELKIDICKDDHQLQIVPDESYNGDNALLKEIKIFNILFNYSIYSYADYNGIGRNVSSINDLHFAINSTKENITMLSDWCAHYNLFNITGYNVPININPRRVDNKYIDIEKLNEISMSNIMKLCFLFHLDENCKIQFHLRQIGNNNRIKYIKINDFKNIDSIYNKEYTEKWIKKYELNSSYKSETYINYVGNKTNKILGSDYYKINNKEQYLETIINDNSYITEKIRHTLAYYKLSEEQIIPKGAFAGRIELDQIINITNDIDENGLRKIQYFGKDLYIDKNNNVYNNNKQSFFKDKSIKIELHHLLPPPIFETELLFEDERSFNSLSSGERQLAYIRSNFLYHLVNINSAQNIKYNNVLVMFDEVELYLHPEWQRQFISNLLEGIELAKFDNIKHINMLISTHSPFILSDVPKSNILFLNEDGTQNNEERVQTFGANIHDLLKDGFFMESTIGEYARKQIQEIVDLYYNFKKNKTITNKEEQKKEYYWHIQSIIGDQYYSKTLKFMLEEIYGTKPENEIKQLKKEIAEKQERLKHLEGGN